MPPGLGVHDDDEDPAEQRVSLVVGELVEEGLQGLREVIGVTRARRGWDADHEPGFGHLAERRRAGAPSPRPALPRACAADSQVPLGVPRALFIVIVAEVARLSHPVQVLPGVSQRLPHGADVLLRGVPRALRQVHRARGSLPVQHLLSRHPTVRVPMTRGGPRRRARRSAPREEHPVQESHQREVGEHQTHDAPGVLSRPPARASARAARRPAGAPLQLAGQQRHLSPPPPCRSA